MSVGGGVSLACHLFGGLPLAGRSWQWQTAADWQVDHNSIFHTHTQDDKRQQKPQTSQRKRTAAAVTTLSTVVVPLSFSLLIFSHFLRSFCCSASSTQRSRLVVGSRLPRQSAWFEEGETEGA